MHTVADGDPMWLGDPALRRPGWVIEAPRPLSESGIWAAHLAYYERMGVAAWSTGDVPYRLTSGPIVARTYASLIEAFVADLASGRGGNLHPDAPLYVIELGAGSGRLGFELLRALETRDLGGLRLVVVLTDIVEANVEFWLGHAALRPYLETGNLDVAHYEAASPAELTLRYSGETLGNVVLSNPPVLIANYVFDVLAQDLYSVVDGVLYENEVALCSSDPSTPMTSTELFEDLFLLQHPVVPERRAIAEDEILLQRRAATAGAGERFLFPGAALKTLRAFEELGGGRLLTLIGERPWHRIGTTDEQTAARSTEEGGEGLLIRAEDNLATRPGQLLPMGVHGGSISLPIDFPILSDFATMHDGDLLLPVGAPNLLVVASALFGLRGMLGFRRRYHQILKEQAPEDVFQTVMSVIDAKAEAPFGVLLGALRLSGCDAFLLRQCFLKFEEQLPLASDELAEEAVRVLFELEANDYPMDGYIPLAIGKLLAPTGRYEDALRCFARAVVCRGRYPEGLYEMARCHLQLEEVNDGLSLLEEAIELDPTYSPAVELRARVLSGEGLSDQ